MNMMTKTLALALIYAISASSLSARGVRVPGPDELAAQSTLICNGLVESIAEDGTDKGHVNPWESVNHFTAKIKVLHVFKGDAPAEIEIKYPLGPNGLGNGPIQIQLTAGARFRFFLKSGPNAPYYVGVLDGQYDDGFAVEPLSPQEPDDSAYIPQAEAIAIAKQWVKDNHPELPPLVENPRLRSIDGRSGLPPVNLTYSLPPASQPALVIGSCYPSSGKWILTVMEKSASGAIVGDKRIIILSDRAVDKQSWTKWP
jgi:hypothetical protein